MFAILPGTACRDTLRTSHHARLLPGLIEGSPSAVRVLVAAAMCFVLAASAASGASRLSASPRLTDTSPLTLRGAHFGARSDLL